MSAEQANLIIDALLAAVVHEDANERTAPDDLEKSSMKEAA